MRKLVLLVVGVSMMMVGTYPSIMHAPMAIGGLGIFYVGFIVLCITAPKFPPKKEDN